MPTEAKTALPSGAICAAVYNVACSRKLHPYQAGYMNDESGSGQKQIEKALKLLARREGVQRNNLLEMLDGELRPLADAWGIDSGKGLDAARVTIYASLAAHLGQLTPPQRRPQERRLPTTAQRVEQFRRVVFVLFNVLPSTSKLGLTKQEARYRWLDSDKNHVVEDKPRAKRIVSLRINSAAARRDMDYAIAEIAKMLARRSRDDKAERLDDRREPEEQEVPSTPFAYIRRPALESRFGEAMGTGGSVILIHGEPGTGKTTFTQYAARAYLRAKRTDYLPTVVGDTDETLRDSLTRVIQHVGHPPESGLPALTEQFKKLLSGELAPTVVVLDNINSREQLISLLPTNPTTYVVVTSRKKLLDDTEATLIRLSHMDPDEARALVQRHAPNLSDDEAVTVAEALDRRPLAILHGCACLINPPYSGNVAAFRAALNRNAGAVLESYGDDDEPTLTAIYRMILDQLAKQPYVLDLLDIALLIGPADPFRQLLRLAWPSITAASSPDDPRRYAPLLPEDEGLLVKALRILERWNLVDPDAAYRPMHELTRQVLRSLRRDQAPDVAVRAFMCLHHRLGFGDWLGGRPLPESWPRMIGLLTTISRTLLPFEGVGGSDALYHTAAIVLRQLRESGFVHGTGKLARRMAATAHKYQVPAPALYRELLELGYLGDVTDEGDDRAMLDAARANLPDPYAQEALLAGDFSPLGATWGVDTVTARLTALINEDFDNLASQTGQKNLLERAQHTYALGVLHFELAKWNEAQVFYSHSRALYQELAKTESAFGMYAAECGRRLGDLGLRCADGALIQENEMTSDYWMQVSKHDKAQPGDSFLFYRHMQSRMAYAVNEALRSLQGEAPVGQGGTHASLDRIVEFYSKGDLSIPLLETIYTWTRLDAVTDPQQAFAGFDRLGNLCNTGGHAVGERVAQLAYLKVGLLGLDDQLTHDFILKAALAIATSFKDTSPYWFADALCLAYAATLLSPDHELAHRVRGHVTAAVNTIGRPDKLTLAEAIGQGSSPVWLLAE